MNPNSMNERTEAPMTRPSQPPIFAETIKGKLNMPFEIYKLLFFVHHSFWSNLDGRRKLIFNVLVN